MVHWAQQRFGDRKHLPSPTHPLYVRRLFKMGKETSETTSAPSASASAAPKTEKTSSQQTGPSAAASRSPIAPPRFFEEDPVIWLVQLDLYFCQIGEDSELSRFRIAATLLPGHLLRDFADILRAPPAKKPYTALSDAIQQRFGRSVEQRLRSLLSDQQLGDRRPSQFLRHLLDLAEAEGSPSQDSPLVRQIFFNAMPTRIQPFLQCLPQGTDLATLAGTADRLLELPPSPTFPQPPVVNPPPAIHPAPAIHPPPAGHPPPAVNAVQTATTPDLPDMMRQLIIGISALTTTVSSLVEVTARRERSASSDHRRLRNHSPPPTPRARSPTQHSRSPTPRGRSQLCWYHHKFGATAHCCQPPCSWKSGNCQ